MRGLEDPVMAFRRPEVVDIGLAIPPLTVPLLGWRRKAWGLVCCKPYGGGRETENADWRA